MSDANRTEEQESSLQLLMRIAVIFFLGPAAILLVVRFAFQ